MKHLKLWENFDYGLPQVDSRDIHNTEEPNISRPNTNSVADAILELGQITVDGMMDNNGEEIYNIADALSAILSEHLPDLAATGDIYDFFNDNLKY